MPADSWPRCCRAKRPKYVSRATSRPGAWMPKTPHIRRVRPLVGGARSLELDRRSSVEPAGRRPIAPVAPSPSSADQSSGRHATTACPPPSPNHATASCAPARRSAPSPRPERAARPARRRARRRPRRGPRQQRGRRARGSGRARSRRRVAAEAAGRQARRGSAPGTRSRRARARARRRRRPRRPRASRRGTSRTSGTSPTQPTTGVGWIARAVGLVVERDVSGHDRNAERLAGARHALDRLGQLPGDLGPLRIAEVEAVGDGERPAAGAGDVSRRLEDGERAAGPRVERGERAPRRRARPPGRACDGRRRRTAASSPGRRTVREPTRWS